MAGMTSIPIDSLVITIFYYDAPPKRTHYDIPRKWIIYIFGMFEKENYCCCNSRRWWYEFFVFLTPLVLWECSDVPRWTHINLALSQTTTNLNNISKTTKQQNIYILHIDIHSIIHLFLLAYEECKLKLSRLPVILP